MKIVNNKDRSILGEGRTFQMGFAFLKSIGNETFETVQPISPCKDYLNDVVYSEHTGNDIYAYGLDYKKQGIFDGEKAYIAISICTHQGYDYDNFTKDKENLDGNFKNLESFMHFFDEQVHAKVKTSINKIEDNLFLVELDNIWCTSTYMISLYTLLLRAGQFWKNTKQPMDYLDKYKAFTSDVYLMQLATPKLKHILAGNIPKQDFSTLMPNTETHNTGIVSYKITTC